MHNSYYYTKVRRKFCWILFMQYLTVDILQNIRTIKNRTQYEYWWSCSSSIMFSECVLLFAWATRGIFNRPFKVYKKKLKFVLFNTLLKAHAAPLQNKIVFQRNTVFLKTCFFNPTFYSSLMQLDSNNYYYSSKVYWP